jgi:hypothetical protein
MPINFPNSPSIGSTYDYEGIHYIYNGAGWVNKSIYGISAGTNISFANYNGTGPLIISATDTTGITSAVTSFNGLTGAVQGVSAAVAGTGISVSGATGSVTITNTGVLSFNGLTGAVQGVSSINGATGAISNVAFTNTAQTFSAIQSFSSGISASYVKTDTIDSNSLSITPLFLSVSSATIKLKQDNGLNQYFTTISGAGSAASSDRTITLPDDNGTVALTKNIVSSFNGLTGAVQGVSSAVAGTGISVSGATGSVTISNTGVLSFNGRTGAVQGVSSINGSTGAITNVAFTNIAQVFTQPQNFSQGLTAANTVEFYADTSYFYPVTKGNRYVSITPGPINYVSANGNSALVLSQNIGNAIYIGDYDSNNNSTYIRIEDNTQSIGFNYNGVEYKFPTGVGSANQVLTTDGIGQLSWTTVSSSGGGVSSFNGLTGAVQGVSAAIGGTGISVSGATGSVTITNTGVRSFNGSTGDVTYNALSRYIASISTNTTAGSTANTDFVYVCTAGLTLTLPTAVSNTNRYSVKNTSSSVVKVFTTSSQAIDGITSGYNLTRQYQAIDVISDGSNWFVI